MRITVLGRRWRLVFARWLGRGVHGLCDPPNRQGKAIYVLSRLRGEACLEVLIHECLHAAGWNLDEEWVDQVSADIARGAFRDGVRERIWDDEGRGA